ncbi:unnamed protein product [Peronospora farinosa]|uniref:RRM domain-containing protein n=1 Tax=Peronospora farinosa TaxID=134698 RepID=A0AAV0ST11_9STRA|nr:unnamed protein product [Peronospora farinosa]
MVSPRLSPSRSRSRSSTRSTPHHSSPSRTERKDSISHSRSRSRSISLEKSPQTKKIAFESVTLRVENLTRNVNADHLREIFGKFGLVVCVNMTIPRGKASAVVVLATQKDADNAKEHMHDGWLDGNKLRVIPDVSLTEPSDIRRTTTPRAITTRSSLSPKGRNRRNRRLRSPILRNRNRSPLRNGRGRRFAPSPFRGRSRSRSFNTNRRGVHYLFFEEDDDDLQVHFDVVGA